MLYRSPPTHSHTNTHNFMSYELMDFHACQHCKTCSDSDENTINGQPVAENPIWHQQFVCRQKKKKEKKKHPSANQGWRLNKALTLNLSCATSSLKPVAMIPLGRKESGSYSISSLFSLFPITNDASSSNSDNGSQITARVYPNLVTLERNNKKPLSTLQLQSKAQFIPTS